MALAHLEWRVPVPFVSLRLGPYTRTPGQLTVAPYVAAGWADRPVPGTPWVATPGTRVTLGLGLEWLGVVRVEGGGGGGNAGGRLPPPGTPGFLGVPSGERGGRGPRRGGPW